MLSDLDHPTLKALFILLYKKRLGNNEAGLRGESSACLDISPCPMTLKSQSTVNRVRTIPGKCLGSTNLTIPLLSLPPEQLFNPRDTQRKNDSDRERSVLASQNTFFYVFVCCCLFFHTWFIFFFFCNLSAKWYFSFFFFFHSFSFYLFMLLLINDHTLGYCLDA